MRATEARIQQSANDYYDPGNYSEKSVILIFGIMGEVSLAVVQLMAWAWL